jgi:hypothetical protein
LLLSFERTGSLRRDYLLLSFERRGSLRREDRRKTHLDGCETAEDVGAAGAVVGHEKLEERERKVVQF